MNVYLSYRYTFLELLLVSCLSVCALELRAMYM